jgi:hypothetical protein
MTQANEPASLPPPETSGGTNSLQTKLAALVQELRRSCRDYGLESDDPFSPVMKALILVLEWLGAFVAELRKITIDYGSQALQRSHASRAADEAAVLHMEKHMEVISLHAVTKLQDGLGLDFKKIMARQVWVQVWKNSLIATVVFTASILASTAYGYYWGRSNAQASIHETEAELRAAFKNGVSGASHWLGLMTWNDIEYALNQCATNPRLDISEHGRRACQVQLWIEEDAGSPDIVIDDIALRARKAQADLEARAEKQEAQEKAKADAAAQAKLKLVPERGKTSK